MKMKRNFSLEKVIKIWDDDHGTHIDVGPDSDGLGLVEIKQFDEDNKCINRIVMTQEEAILLAEAINLLYKTNE